MSTIGHSSLVIALVVSVYSFIMSVWAARSHDTVVLQSIRRAILVIFILVSLASGILLYALLSRDFSIEYVTNYSSKSLSVFYTISAFWAGQAGSLLFWTWLLSLYTFIVSVQNRNKNYELFPYSVAILSITTFFFLFLATFKTSPFITTSHPPADGNGLNPLLQNIEMIFHPPTLYVGFVGFAVPFAFAMSALLTRQLDEHWLKSIRRWTLFSWLFLTIGNLLGAQWAYVELGWGGYWAWDPVENASLLPWLTGTAFLHSIIAQERKGMLKVWNMVLIIITFILTIFGTFVTRSGIISSVHAYAISNLGPPFLIFLFIIIGFSFFLLVSKVSLLKNDKQITTWSSKESSFLLNNLVFLALALVVFIGTILPTISEIIRNQKITVGPEFFNRISVPFGIGLLLLMGICAMLAWGKTSTQRIFKNFYVPAIIAIVIMVILFVLGIDHFKAIITFGISVFVLVIVFTEFIKGSIRRKQKTDLNILKSFTGMVTQHPRRYGGYVVHIGVVLLFIGIAGSSGFRQETSVTLKKGESTKAAHYTVRFDSLQFVNSADQETAIAHFNISKGDRNIGKMTSEKIFQTSYQPVTEVGIRSTLREDLYVILAGFENPQEVSVKILINPLVIWMWIGSVVMIIGTVIAIGIRKQLFD